ncbi:MAG: bifunctional adenosylcobinamide kinase/adenosylcobinamide-phosphate guanylyltransferase [Synergistaceae bacterium]|nr:bifunctional adenosylcobinamide kinase/adenosylcobinamide-phosphate guanylyltransferase [Synergistaceae bacterium]
MMILILGTARSGKSSYAETRLESLKGLPKIYAAMSRIEDDEMRERVKRHQAMRSCKGFMTVECGNGLKAEDFPEGSAVLIESLTAWTANEMFCADGVRPCGDVVEKILSELSELGERVREVVIVSDDIFCDGVRYEGLTEEYVKCLAELTVKIAESADEVTEVFSGLPFTYKTSQS